MAALNSASCSRPNQPGLRGCTKPISVQRAGPAERTRRTSPVSVQRPASPALLACAVRPSPPCRAPQEMDILPARAHNRVPTCSTCNYMRSPNKRLALRNRTPALLCPSTFKHGTGYLQGKGLTRRWTSRVYVGPKDARRKRICLVGTPSAMPGVFFGVAPGRGVSSHREPNRKGNA